jgi:hypothetical protein
VVHFLLSLLNRFAQDEPFREESAAAGAYWKVNAGIP